MDKKITSTSKCRIGENLSESWKVESGSKQVSVLMGSKNSWEKEITKI